MKNFLKKFKLTFRVVAGLLVLTHSTTQIASAQLSLPISVFSIQQNFSQDHLIYLPPSLGLIEEIHRGKRKEFVFLIQDAHSNYSAQKNIAATIEFLSKKQKIDLVAVEGAHGEIDTDIFRAFPSRVVTKNVLDRYMRKGEIGGPQFWASLSRAPLPFIGIDEDRLYKKNLNEFLSVTNIQNPGFRKIRELKTEIKNRAHFQFSAKHREFDQLWERWKNGLASLDKITEEMAEKCRQLAIDIAGYPQLALLKNVIASRGAVNQSQTHIEALKLLQEIETLRFRIKNALSKSENEFELIRLQEYSELLDRGLKLELTRPELKRLKFLAKEFRFKEIELPVFAFYKTAEDRDALFVKRLRKEMASRLKHIAILVCGGFHREGVARLLRKAGYSYAIVRPNISEHDSRNSYFHLMQKSASLLRQSEQETLSFRVPLAENTFADTKPLVSKIIEEQFKTVAENPKRYGFGSLSDVVNEWRGRGEIVVAGNQMWSPATLRWALETWDRKFTGFGITTSNQRDKLVEGLELFGLTVPSNFAAEFGAAPPTIQESLDDLIETVKNDSDKDRRWHAMTDLASGHASSPKRNNALLYGLSDPHTLNRQYVSYRIAENADFPEDALLDYIKNPGVPKENDPRMPHLLSSKYELAVARRNARLSGLFTLLAMLRTDNRPALSKKLKRIISDQAHEWITSGQNEIQDIDILDPLSTENTLSLFQILRLFMRSYQENNRGQLNQALRPMGHEKYFWAYQAVKSIYPNIIDDPVAPLIYKPINDEAAKWMRPHYADVGFGARQISSLKRLIRKKFGKEARNSETESLLTQLKTKLEESRYLVFGRDFLIPAVILAAQSVEELAGLLRSILEISDREIGQIQYFIFAMRPSRAIKREMKLILAEQIRGVVPALASPQEFSESLKVLPELMREFINTVHDQKTDHTKVGWEKLTRDAYLMKKRGEGFEVSVELLEPTEPAGENRYSFSVIPAFKLPDDQAAIKKDREETLSGLFGKIYPSKDDLVMLNQHNNAGKYYYITPEFRSETNPDGLPDGGIGEFSEILEKLEKEYLIGVKRIKVIKTSELVTEGSLTFSFGEKEIYVYFEDPETIVVTEGLWNEISYNSWLKNTEVDAHGQTYISMKRKSGDESFNFFRDRAADLIWTAWNAFIGETIEEFEEELRISSAQNIYNIHGRVITDLEMFLRIMDLRFKNQPLLTEGLIRFLGYLLEQHAFDDGRISILNMEYLAEITHEFIQRSFNFPRPSKSRVSFILNSRNFYHYQRNKKPEDYATKKIYGDAVPFEKLKQTIAIIRAAEVKSRLAYELSHFDTLYPGERWRIDHLSTMDWGMSDITITSGAKLVLDYPLPSTGHRPRLYFLHPDTKTIVHGIDYEANMPFYELEVEGVLGEPKSLTHDFKVIVGQSKIPFKLFLEEHMPIDLMKEQHTVPQLFIVENGGEVVRNKLSKAVTVYLRGNEKRLGIDFERGVIESASIGRFYEEKSPEEEADLQEPWHHVFEPHFAPTDDPDSEFVLTYHFHPTLWPPIISSTDISSMIRDFFKGHRERALAPELILNFRREGRIYFPRPNVNWRRAFLLLRNLSASQSGEIAWRTDAHPEKLYQQALKFEEEVSRYFDIVTLEFNEDGSIKHWERLPKPAFEDELSSLDDGISGFGAKNNKHTHDLSLYKKAFVLRTGGTIETAGARGRRSVDAVQALIDQNAQLVSHSEKLYERLPDSSSLGPKDWNKILSRLDSMIGEKNALQKKLAKRKNPGPPGGIVITAGTDTVEDLGLLTALQLVPKLHSQDPFEFPIIFVGAKTPSDMPGSDAPQSFKLALELAASGKLPPQVYFVYKNRIYLASRIRKAIGTVPFGPEAAERAARGEDFDSHTPIVGWWENGQIHIEPWIHLHDWRTWQPFTPKNVPDFEKADVELLFVGPTTPLGTLEDAGNRLIRWKSEGQKVGLVLHGDISKQLQTQEWYDVLRNLREKGILIYSDTLARFFDPNARPPVAEHFVQLGPYQARIKLLWALANLPEEAAPGDVAYVMEHDIGGEKPLAESPFRPQTLDTPLDFPENNYEAGQAVVPIYGGIRPKVIEDSVRRLISSTAIERRLIMDGNGDGNIPLGNKSFEARVFDRVIQFDKPLAEQAGKFLHKNTGVDRNVLLPELLLNVLSAAILKREDAWINKFVLTYKGRIRSRTQKARALARRFIKDALMASDPLLHAIGTATDLGIHVEIRSRAARTVTDTSLYEPGNMLLASGVDSQITPGWKQPLTSKNAGFGVESDEQTSAALRDRLHTIHEELLFFQSARPFHPLPQELTRLIEAYNGGGLATLGGHIPSFIMQFDSALFALPKVEPEELTDHWKYVARHLDHAKRLRNNLQILIALHRLNHGRWPGKAGLPEFLDEWKNQRSGLNEKLDWPAEFGKDNTQLDTIFSLIELKLAEFISQNKNLEIVEDLRRFRILTLFITYLSYREGEPLSENEMLWFEQNIGDSNLPETRTPATGFGSSPISMFGGQVVYLGNNVYGVPRVFFDANQVIMNISFDRNRFDIEQFRHWISNEMTEADIIPFLSARAAATIPTTVTDSQHSKADIAFLMPVMVSRLIELFPFHYYHNRDRAFKALADIFPDFFAQEAEKILHKPLIIWLPFHTPDLSELGNHKPAQEIIAELYNNLSHEHLQASLVMGLPSSDLIYRAYDDLVLNQRENKSLHRFLVVLRRGNKLYRLAHRYNPANFATEFWTQLYYPGYFIGEKREDTLKRIAEIRAWIEEKMAPKSLFVSRMLEELDRLSRIARALTLSNLETIVDSGSAEKFGFTRSDFETFRKSLALSPDAAEPTGFGAVPDVKTGDQRVSELLGTDLKTFTLRMKAHAPHMWNRLKAASKILSEGLRLEDTRAPLSVKLFDDVRKLRRAKQHHWAIAVKETAQRIQSLERKRSSGFGAEASKENTFDYSKDQNLKTIRESFDPKKIREAIYELSQSRKYPAHVISELLNERWSEHERLFHRSRFFNRARLPWLDKLLTSIMLILASSGVLMVPLGLFGPSAALTLKYSFYAATWLLLVLFAMIPRMPLRLTFKINLSGAWETLLGRFHNLVAELFHLQANSIYLNPSEKLFDAYFNARKNFWIEAYQFIPLAIFAIAFIDSFLPHVLRRIAPPFSESEVFLGTIAGMLTSVYSILYPLYGKFLKTEEAWRKYEAAEEDDLKSAAGWKSSRSKVRFLESGVPYSKTKGWEYFTEDITGLIEGLAKIPAKGGGFLGIGSFHNLDIALDRDTEAIVIFDRDREVVELNLDILRLIETTEHFDKLYPAVQKLLETKDVMNAELFEQYVNDGNTMMGRTPLSWAKNEENFNRLKRLISKGRVAVAHADLTEPSSLERVYNFFRNFSVPLNVINLGDLEGPGYPLSPTQAEKMKHIPEALSTAGAHADTLIIASSGRSEPNFKKHFGERAAHVRFLTPTSKPIVDESALIRFVSHHFVRTFKDVEAGQLFIDSLSPGEVGSGAEAKTENALNERFAMIAEDAQFFAEQRRTHTLPEELLRIILSYEKGALQSSSIFISQFDTAMAELDPHIEQAHERDWEFVRREFKRANRLRNNLLILEKLEELQDGKWPGEEGIEELTQRWYKEKKVLERETNWPPRRLRDDNMSLARFMEITDDLLWSMTDELPKFDHWQKIREFRNFTLFLAFLTYEEGLPTPDRAWIEANLGVSSSGFGQEYADLLNQNMPHIKKITRHLLGRLYPEFAEEELDRWSNAFNIRQPRWFDIVLSKKYVINYMIIIAVVLGLLFVINKTIVSIKWWGVPIALSFPSIYSVIRAIRNTRAHFSRKESLSWTYIAEFVDLVFGKAVILRPAFFRIATDKQIGTLAHELIHFLKHGKKINRRGVAAAFDTLVMLQTRKNAAISKLGFATNKLKQSFEKWERGLTEPEEFDALARKWAKRQNPIERRFDPEPDWTYDYGEQIGKFIYRAIKGDVQKGDRIIRLMIDGDTFPEALKKVIPSPAGFGKMNFKPVLLFGAVATVLLIANRIIENRILASAKKLLVIFDKDEHLGLAQKFFARFQENFPEGIEFLKPEDPNAQGLTGFIIPGIHFVPSERALYLAAAFIITIALALAIRKLIKKTSGSIRSTLKFVFYSLVVLLLGQSLNGVDYLRFHGVVDYLFSGASPGDMLMKLSVLIPLTGAIWMLLPKKHHGSHPPDEKQAHQKNTAGFGVVTTQIPEVIQAAVTHLENTRIANFHSGAEITDIRTLIFSGPEEAEGFALAMKNETFASNFSRVSSVIFAWGDPTLKNTLKEQLKDVLPNTEIHAENPESALNLLTLASSALLVGEANPMILTETPPVVLEHMPNNDMEAITALVRAVRLQEKIQKLYRVAA